MTKVKEWNAKGSKKLIYCFGSGELPIVDTKYLQSVLEVLGGDAQHYVSSRNRPVYMMSDTGRAIIARCVEKQALTGLNAAFTRVSNYSGSVIY
ncbi:hypothetical protein FACS1894188_07570 [Clostridia bacterium]|nr:hypothetical protein FACS1894188_07570 [Clostridia bacterium]